MNDDSIRKTACTIPRRKPIARSTPICWRRSTTARCADHAQRRHADDQPETHEALDQAVEGAVRGQCVVEDLLDRLGLHAVREERGLEPGRSILGVDARAAK